MGKTIAFIMALTLWGCTYSNDPSASNVHVSLAVAYLQQGDLENARKILNSISQLPMTDREFWGAKGYLEEQSGNISLAATAYRRAIALHPNSGENHNNYGVFLCRHHRPKEGLKEILTAIHQPSYIYLSSAYENAALCAKKIPDYSAALTYHQAALRNAGKAAPDL